ncbi:MAG: hypothetical protein NTX82_06785 [Candidatus Parcubacteria bacterium]|nr:hypothetical protein [Candidatus Parcubacteria bacterium]
MRMLLIDDVRSYANMSKIARTFEQGIEALKEGNWDVLYLDHDLGQPEPKNGYQILCWLEEHLEFLPKQIVLVTSNPVGRQKMEMVLKKLFSQEG